MLKRHEDSLMNHFDEVAKTGWSVINWWELYLWYNMDRLGKNVYRDLRDRFQEENKGELYIYEAEQHLVLIHNDGLKSISQKLGESTDA